MGVAWVVMRAWVTGLVDGMLSVVTEVVVAGVFIIAWVVGFSDLEVVAAI